MARRQSPRHGAALAERVAALEAAWASALDGLSDKVALAVRTAMEEAASNFASKVAHDGVDARVLALEAQVRELVSRSAYAAGVVKVEERVRSNAQEWARTLTPIVFGLGLTIVGSIWALQIGGV